MFFRSGIISLLVAVLILVCMPPAVLAKGKVAKSPVGKATKLLLDTDIGSDVDDAFALLLALASPERKLIAVTTVHGYVDVRAKIAAKELALAGRTDVPVYLGLEKPLTPNRGIVWRGYEGENIDLSGADAVKIEDGAVDKIVELAKKYGKDLDIAAIGPLTNIAAAIRKDPEAMRGIDRLYIMGSVFIGLYYEGSSHEHNFDLDPVASKEVLSSGMPITLIGLNLTRRTIITREEVAGLKHSPLGKFVAQMSDQYMDIRERDWTYMHDPVAITAMVNPYLIRAESYHPEVTAEGDEAGRTIFYPSGQPMIDIGVDVPVAEFHKFILGRFYEKTK